MLPPLLRPAQLSSSTASTTPKVVAADITRDMQAVSNVLGAMGTSAVPPVQEIVDALKRAEEVAKFLQQQTQFWMEQASHISRTHQPNVAANVDFGGLFPTAPMAPPVPQQQQSQQQPLQQPLVQAQAAHPVALQPAVPQSAPESTPQLPSLPPPEPATVSPGALASSPVSGNPERSMSVETAGESTPSSEIAEIRRMQKEAWERRRSNSSVGGGTPGGGSTSAGAGGVDAGDSATPTATAAAAVTY